MNIIDRLGGFAGWAQKHSARIAAAGGPEPEKTWLNHGLITLGAALIGAAFGFPFGIWLLGARIGAVVAVKLYLYREVRQWWGAPKPAGWWWDASLDVLMPTFFASALFSPAVFLAIAVAIALLHFALRPIPQPNDP